MVIAPQDQALYRHRGVILIAANASDFGGRHHDRGAEFHLCHLSRYVERRRLPRERAANRSFDPKPILSSMAAFYWTAERNIECICIKGCDHFRDGSLH